MKNENKYFRGILGGKKGFIIPYALIASGVVAVLLGGLLFFVQSAQKSSSKEVFSQQSLQYAESGIYFYKWYLAHNLDGKNAKQIKNFWESGDAYGLNEPYEEAIKDIDGRVLGYYSLEVEIPASESTIVFVTSTGWTVAKPSQKRSVKVRFRRPSWSEYAVLANDVMRFGEGTVVSGPMHSNDGIRFDGVANNLVTSSVDTYYDPDTYSIKPGVWTSKADESSVFLAGNDFPVEAVDFNGATTDLSLIRDEAQINGIYLADETYTTEVCGWKRGYASCGTWGWCYLCSDEDADVEAYHLTLRIDDKVEVRRVFSFDDYRYEITDESSAEILNFPENGLIFVNKSLWLDGKIDDARITIASADLEPTGLDTDVYINNDILYTNKDGTDVIGIIAENNITVGYYSEDNLEIDAALLAQKGRVGRDYYSWGFYRRRDEITLWGSMATNERYGFAYTDGTGYNIRSLNFDNNLLYFPPPYFPTGTVYEFDLWEDL